MIHDENQVFKDKLVLFSVNSGSESLDFQEGKILTNWLLLPGTALTWSSPLKFDKKRIHLSSRMAVMPVLMGLVLS